MPNELLGGDTATASQATEKTGVEITGSQEETESFDLTQHLLLKVEEKPKEAVTDDEGKEVAPEGEEKAVDTTETTDEVVDGELTDDPKPEVDTDTQVVDYENVLSHVDFLSELSEENLEALNQYVVGLTPSLTKKLKRFDGLRKQAEETLVEYKRTHEKPEVQVRIEGENPLRHISDLVELNKQLASWQEVVYQAQDAMTNGLNPDDVVMTIQGEDGPVEITKKKMGVKLAEGRKYIKEHGPDQKRFLKDRDTFTSALPARFSWHKNKTSAEYRQRESVKTSTAFAGMIQNHVAGEFVASCIAEHMVTRKNNAAGKKVAGKPPPTQGTRVSGKRNSTRIKSTSRESIKKTALDQLSAKGGTKASLESYLLKTRQ